MTSAWFAISPSDTAFARLSLDFGLRGAILHFNELVVPGIGGGRFVRQFSWAVAGLSVAAMPEVRARRLAATPIAHGIEALACKSEYRARDTESSRILGKRAFGRDGEDVSSFAALRQRAHYVQNTFRARLVRALRAETGLGLADGTRYDALQLSPVGTDLAKAFLDDQRVGQGGRILRGWLADWVLGERTPSWASLGDALTPSRATKAESAILRARLVEVQTAQGERRREVAEVLEDDGFTTPGAVVRGLRRRKREAAALDLELAIAFGSLLASAVRVLEQLSDRIEADGPRAPATLAKPLSAELDDVTRKAAAYLERAQAAPHGHADANDLARRATRMTHADLLAHLVKRDDRVTTLADDRIVKGPLFRNLLVERGAEDEDDENDDDEGASRRTAKFRLGRFYELLLDTRGKKP